MWGTPISNKNVYLKDRFIPTHVGNTGQLPGRRSARPVHPHACGEHLETGLQLFANLGSSPRMWGTLPRLRDGGTRGRFIPTHVGNTPDRGRPAGLNPVHPHACGEHRSHYRERHWWIGSSPRMWGTLLQRTNRRLRYRFIPTHVGNTIGARRAYRIVTVHPHACGEHRAFSTSTLSVCGSSPRMWGTRQRLEVHHRMQRFIPTHVGNTRATARWS